MTTNVLLDSRINYVTKHFGKIKPQTSLIYLIMNRTVKNNIIYLSKIV